MVEPKSRDRPAPVDEKDFLAGNVERAVFKKTIQHPATIYPLFFSLGLMFWMVAIGFNPVIFLTCLLSAFTGAIAWVYHYFFKGVDLTHEHVRLLRTMKREYESSQIGSLTQDCYNADFSDGERECGELLAVYLKLMAVLEKVEGSVAGSSYGILAKEALAQGQNLISSALDLHKALEKIDVAKARRELNKATLDLDKISDKSSTRARSLSDKINSNKDLVKAYDDMSAERDSRLDKVDALESELEEVVLNLSSKSDPTEALNNNGESISKFKAAIEAAKNMERDLRQARGEISQAERDLYLKSS